VTSAIIPLIARSSESIAAIIPAYNEAERIEAVLSAATQVSLFSQIIVVDDGSSDGTPGVARQWQRRDPRIELVRLEKNQGKATAIATGAHQAAGDIVTLLDADLIGLEPGQIRQLIYPVLHRQCVMTLGLFRHGRPSTDVMHRHLPFLSGQRCLRWSLFEDIFRVPTAGWSLETALNLHAWYHQYPTRRIPLNGVTHAMRPEKQPGLQGYVSHVAMWVHIARYALHFVRDNGVGSILARLRESRPATAVFSLASGPRRNKAEFDMRRPLL
jgi:glycosyltransferase involved in cell wall biosynthesis